MRLNETLVSSTGATRISCFLAHRCRNIHDSAAQSRLRSSAQGQLRPLCAFLHEKAVFMEKPFKLTAFLHDIGLFMEKHLSASSIKGVQAFRLSLHTPWCNARRPYMPGIVLNLTTIRSSSYRSGDFCLILARVVSKFIEIQGFRPPLGRV